MASGVINGAQDSKGYYLRLNWSSTGNASNNTSSVTITLTLISTKPGYYFSNYGITNGIKAKDSASSSFVQWGTQQNNQYSIANPTTSTPRSVQLYSYTRNTTHAADGTKTLNLQGYASVNSPASFTFNSLSVAGNAVLDNLTPPITYYTFTYDGTSVQVASGGYYNVPNPTPPTGYSFKEWNTKADGTGQSYTSPFQITAPLTVFSVYQLNKYTINFIENGGDAVSNVTDDYGKTVTLPSAARSGYRFDGWYADQGLADGPYTSWTISGGQDLYAKWTVLAPGFTDETVTPIVPINVDVSTLTDRTIAASNVNPTGGYSIVYGGTGITPTWLTINDSGQLSGSTNLVGNYTFRVRATNAGGFTDSNVITISVVYPGTRITNSLLPVDITSAKRFNGTNWVDITSIKKWNGSSWVDITN